MVHSPAPQLPLLSAAQARAGDDAAIAAGVSGSQLMDMAATHLAQGVLGFAGYGYGLAVTIVVGKGNNGGDGWAAARRLRARGADVWVVAPDGFGGELSEEAAANRDAWLRSSGRALAGEGGLDVALARAEIAVDALLGTGSRGAPRGPTRGAIIALRRARTAGVAIVACDVPSGVDANTGKVADWDGDAASRPERGAAVIADLTVTFGALKRGLVLHPGAGYAGEVVVGDLGDHYDPGEVSWSALTPAGAAPASLPTAADKRARGTVVAVAGSLGTAGAAALTSEGSLRAGAGLVTAAVPDVVRGDVAAAVDPGVMVHPLPSDTNGEVADEAIHALPSVEFGAVVAGPGLGYGPGAKKVVARLRETSPLLVLDADALNVHRDAPQELAEHVGHLVLTPHERELARIGGGEDGPDAWEHRIERVPALAQQLHATVVVKGPATMVVAPDGRVWVCPVGGPALGSGGTGDVLAGIVGAAVAAIGVDGDVPLAVAQAVWWHAAAGIRAGAKAAERSTATDVLAELPGVLAELTAAARPPIASRPGGPSRAPSTTRWRLPWSSWSVRDGDRVTGPSRRGTT